MDGGNGACILLLGAENLPRVDAENYWPRRQSAV